MTRAEYEIGLYASMQFRTDLLRLLRYEDKSIYHQLAPSGAYDRCPFVVYSVISDEPFLTGDNRELASKLTVRFHIVTEDGGYDDIDSELRELMQTRGAVRLSSRAYVEEGRKILITDYADILI